MSVKVFYFYFDDTSEGHIKINKSEHKGELEKISMNCKVHWNPF